MKAACTALGLWICLILALASGAFSAAHTAQFFGPFFAWLFPFISEAARLHLHFFLRKAAHVTEYAVLYTLACRPLRMWFPENARYIAFWALCVVLVVACLDEFWQFMTPYRTGTVKDVALDFSGGLLAALLLALVAKRTK